MNKFALSIAIFAALSAGASPALAQARGNGTGRGRLQDVSARIIHVGSPEEGKWCPCPRALRAIMPHRDRLNKVAGNRGCAARPIPEQ